jgi:hypothetical protein
MHKIDFKKTLRTCFEAPVGDFVLVDVPELAFAMVDGAGDPNVSPDYGTAVEALYALSYRLKFMSKAGGRDYVVGPLQGLWWSADMADFAERRKDNWSWTMMIMQPDWTTPEMFSEAAASVRAKGVTLPETLRLEALAEGLSVQTLHVVPMTTRRRPSVGCMRSSCRRTDSSRPASITRSI